MVAVGTTVVVHVVKHPAEIAGIGDRFRQGCVLADKLEASGEFPATKIGTVVALVFFHPAEKHLLEFRDAVFWSGFPGHFESGVYGVSHIPQE